MIMISACYERVTQKFWLKRKRRTYWNGDGLEVSDQQALDSPLTVYRQISRLSGNRDRDLLFVAVAEADEPRWAEESPRLAREIGRKLFVPAFCKERPTAR